jgi:hypothetical protein
MPKGGMGGKSGLHGHAVPDNVRREKPRASAAQSQGKCHRKQTARSRKGEGKGETVR